MMESESSGASGLFCLICYSSKDNHGNECKVNCDFVERTSWSSSASPVELEKALDAYFILKHVLEIPSGNLEDFLRRSPNPEEWVKICGDCYGSFVTKCKRLFMELVQVNRKFEEARRELIVAVKHSVKSHHNTFKGKKKKDKQLVLDVTKEARCFVRDYACCGPSIDKANFTTTSKAIDEMVEEVVAASSSKWAAGDANIAIKEEEGSESEMVEEGEEEMPGMDDQDSHDEDEVGVVETKDGILADVCDDTSDHYGEGGELYPGGHQDSVEAMGEEEGEWDQGSDADEDWSGGDLSESSDDDLENGDEKDKPSATTSKTGRGKMADNLGGGSHRKPKSKKRSKSFPEYDEVMKGIKFKCDICSLSVPSAKSLGHHMKQMHGKGETSLPCPICQKLVSCQSFQGHVTNVHSQSRHQCPHCRKNYKKSSGLSFHMRSAHWSPDQDIPLFSCSFPGCYKSYPQKCELEYHEVYHRPPTLSCSICGKGVYTKKGLRRHELLHETKITRPFICDQCPARYSNRRDLQMHTKNRHQSKDGGNSLEETSTPHPCPTCGKIFKTRRLLTRHINFQHVKKHPVTCEICGKVLDSQSLRFHMKSAHENPLQFPCNKSGCKRMFRTEEAMKRHAMAHDERTEWKCDHCDKLFANAQGLGDHRRRVGVADKAPGPFVCGECGRECKTGGHLKMHMTTHTKVD